MMIPAAASFPLSGLHWCQQGAPQGAALDCRGKWLWGYAVSLYSVTSYRFDTVQQV